MYLHFLLQPFFLLLVLLSTQNIYIWLVNKYLPRSPTADFYLAVKEENISNTNINFICFLKFSILLPSHDTCVQSCLGLALPLLSCIPLYFRHLCPILSGLGLALPLLSSLRGMLDLAVLMWAGQGIFHLFSAQRIPQVDNKWGTSQ